MRQKRLELCTVIFLGLGLTALQAQTLSVLENNGTQIDYALSNIRKMTFSSGNVSVQKTDNTMGVYALSRLNYLSFIDFLTGINESQVAASNTFLTYPNPIVDILNIDLTNISKGEGYISILNLESKIMETKKTSGIGVITFNLSQLPQGIYLCRYTNDVETKTVKIIKK
jgi:hypothetical protein